jgi:hypothetical protein
MSKKLTEFVKNNKDDLNTPKEAFVIFEQPDAYDFVLKKDTIPLFGELSPVLEAPSPSNLIFENRDFSESQRLPLYIVIIVVVMLLFSSVVFTSLFIQKTVKAVADKYGTEVQCDEINKMFTPRDLEIISVDEWHNYYDENATRDTISGMLVCFCQS